MALLRCDKCGSNDTNTFGSWDTPIKILCGKCTKKKYEAKSKVPTNNINKQFE